MISCGLLAIDSPLFVVEYERYPREIELCTFRLSSSLIFFNRKWQGIYSYIYNEPINDETTHS